ncbi:MAG: ABC transporter ATP-binding protein [Clostridia bacterium]|nr:ABC transporter ATP-binding protein [Clostridia bacterium]
MEVLNNVKLSVKDLNKSFDGKKVLNNLNFDLLEGEFLSILGPSGCGKTTLLRILIGLETADSGEILKSGQDISGLSSIDRGMGIVFQNYALFPNMTVLDNVKYALTLRKETKKNAEAIALKTIEQVGLTDQMNKRPSQLSGGQQQRVAIARTLATNPDIILLDEPISALDVTNREIMKAELKALQKKFNVTMLFITHDQEEAFFLSDRIMVMDNGNIQQMDTPLNIYQHPANDYVKEFVVDMLDKKYTDLLRYTGRDAYEK